MMLKPKQQLGVLMLFIAGFLVFVSLLNSNKDSIFLSVIFLFLLFLIFFLSINMAIGFLGSGSGARDSLLAIVLAMAPIYLLALSSLNSVSIMDIIFLIIIEIILIWYIRRQVK
jgi:hypothetical protein